MNREKLEEWLKDISTPTGLSYSGDRTLSNSEVDSILEYVDDLEEVKKVYDIKYRENKVLKEQVLLYKTVLHKIEQYCNDEKEDLIGGGEVCEDVLKIIEEIK